MKPAACRYAPGAPLAGSNEAGAIVVVGRMLPPVTILAPSPRVIWLDGADTAMRVALIVPSINKLPLGVNVSVLEVPPTVKPSSSATLLLPVSVALPAALPLRRLAVMPPVSVSAPFTVKFALGPEVTVPAIWRLEVSVRVKPLLAE